MPYSMSPRSWMPNGTGSSRSMRKFIRPGPEIVPAR
jgi:hypothetical protein